jgi:hypothetical protein
MTLKRAIELLPDDRETASGFRTVVSFLQAHPDETLSPERLSRATGLSADKVELIFAAMAKAFVIDCGDESDFSACTFTPSTVLSLEIRRFLRTGSGSGARLQRGADRFRNRYGTDR